MVWFKMKKTAGPHVQVSVFDGPDRDHLAFCGQFVAREEFFEAFLKERDWIERAEGGLEEFSEILFRNAERVTEEVLEGWGRVCMARPNLGTSWAKPWGDVPASVPASEVLMQETVDLSLAGKVEVLQADVGLLREEVKRITKALEERKLFP